MRSIRLRIGGVVTKRIPVVSKISIDRHRKNKKTTSCSLIVELFGTLVDAVLDGITSLFDEIAYLRRWVIDVEHTIVDRYGDRDGEQDTATH